nr:polysaccharide biosynthesis C-terminal domain-containing protein [Bacteroidales bacterium]
GINRALCLTAFALYRNEKKVLRFVIFNVSLAILRTTFQLLGLFFYEMSFIGYLYGSCVGSGITTIAILAYTYYHSGFHFNLKFLKPLNDFARPIFLYGLIAWGLMYAGRFFLEHYPKELGIYYTAINFALGIQLVLQGIQGATQPEIYRFMKAGTNEHTNEIKQLCNLLLAQTQLFIAIAIVPTMLYLALFYKSDVSEASNYITIIFVDYIIKTQIIIFSYPIYYLKKTKFLFIINSSVLVLNLLLNYMLAPVFFIYGLIISTLLSDIILCLSIYFYQNKIIKIKWNYNKLLLFPFILIFVISATEFLKNLFNINQFITALISVLFIFTSNIILYKNELNKFIKKFI